MIPTFKRLRDQRLSITPLMSSMMLAVFTAVILAMRRSEVIGWKSVVQS